MSSEFIVGGWGRFPPWSETSGMVFTLATQAGGLGNFLGHWRWMCPCLLQRWQSPLRLSLPFGLADRRAGIVYILSISIGVGEGVDGGVGVHTFIGKGDRCVILV